MGQNRSSAVMQQRIEAQDSLDDFPTPPWATRALLAHVLAGVPVPMQSVWEPCCNRGYMARPLREAFGYVLATDVFDYDWPGMASQADFLFAGTASDLPIDWVVMNPPFKLAEQFIDKARNVAHIGVAALVRTSFLEGIGRYQRLFKDTPPTIVAQFAERVPMVKGRVDPAASTATSYCWLVWAPTLIRRPMTWIPPCRSQLERPGDYPKATL